MLKLLIIFIFMNVKYTTLQSLLCDEKQCNCASFDPVLSTECDILSKLGKPHQSCCLLYLVNLHSYNTTDSGTIILFYFGGICIKTQYLPPRKTGLTEDDFLIPLLSHRILVDFNMYGFFNKSRRSTELVRIMEEVGVAISPEKPTTFC
jgi:hypothetical protein